MNSAQTIILIAHEAKTQELIKLIQKRLPVFEHYRLLATQETSEAIRQATELEVTGMFSGRKGGEIQLCGLICSNCIRAVFFIRDPVNPGFDEPDINPFYRACDLNNVPMATNMVGAVALCHWLGRRLDEEKPQLRKVNA
ncbi:methylglyoxal synthase [Aestuariirhabdus litorea]|uniref:Methylglyoxal synthase n=1 Tax=Aestuariirhabdus litorea TaxID=2528527 RepID=A0A3P3VJB4_9GAMM|nr:methylglyoxal synthase [Aestuariirhabdus litorea]RRJ82815.1 methylglyoxal synthase [Aestuariirhabdus litorea]RWW92974.1 methylglyoxal synthase [Endozoicomonadaceae bacterium GTF-13]